MPPCVLDNWLANKCLAGGDGLAEAVRAEQLSRLRFILNYARQRSRFYRERLKNFFEEDFAEPRLADLPFTTAEDILDWKSFLCVSLGEVERVVTLESSGTSGPPKRLAFSMADLAATKDFFKFGMSQLTHEGDRALVLWPGAGRPNGVSALLHDALEEWGIEVFAGCPLTDAASLSLEIEKYNPHVIVAAPRQLAALADLPGKVANRRERGFALRGILSSAEILPPELSRILRDDYGLLVLDHYGMTETGYGGGVECPAHDGYHLRELDLLFEIVDIESGVPLPAGEEGEIVVTTLTREAMPLIRYRTGDVAAMRPGPCRCGSPLGRLSPLKGRIVRKGSHYSIENISKGAFCDNRL